VHLDDVGERAGTEWAGIVLVRGPGAQLQIDDGLDDDRIEPDVRRIEDDGS